MMETLQTIWTALTTENEVLTSLLVTPLTFIEAYILMLLFILFDKYIMVYFLNFVI